MIVAHMDAGYMASWKRGCFLPDVLWIVFSVEAFNEQILPRTAWSAVCYLPQLSEALCSRGPTTVSPPAGARSCWAAGQRLEKMAGQRASVRLPAAEISAPFEFNVLQDNYCNTLKWKWKDQWNAKLEVFKMFKATNEKSVGPRNQIAASPSRIIFYIIYIYIYEFPPLRLSPVLFEIQLYFLTSFIFFPANCAHTHMILAFHLTGKGIFFGICRRHFSPFGNQHVESGNGNQICRPWML